jgi:DNA-binding transcriptional MerR regulator
MHRVFHPRDRVRLALILRGRRLGFALEEIRRIVDMYDQEPGESGQLRYLLDQIAVRRGELEQRRTDIEQTLAELDDVERRCRTALAAVEGPAPGSELDR